jgi:hypothetical protein
MAGNEREGVFARSVAARASILGSAAPAGEAGRGRAVGPARSTGRDTAMESETEIGPVGAMGLLRAIGSVGTAALVDAIGRGLGGVSAAGGCSATGAGPPAAVGLTPRRGA